MPFHPRAAGWAPLLVAAGLVLALSGCSTGPVTSADETQQQTQTPQGQPDEPGSDGQDGGGADGGGDDGQDGGGTDGQDGGGTDGGADPAQSRVRTGPVAQYGGPAYGDQGDAELIEPGMWCKTIAVFWGGAEPVPDGVRFTFESAVADQPGLAVEAGTCGSAGADRTCLGLTVQANEAGIFCSIVVRPTADFVEGTTVSFTGTLECPTSDVCDLVAGRSVEPGPPLVVTTPAGA